MFTQRPAHSRKWQYKIRWLRQQLRGWAKSLSGRIKNKEEYFRINLDELDKKLKQYI